MFKEKPVINEKMKILVNGLTPEEIKELWSFFTRGYVEKTTQFYIGVAILIMTIVNGLLEILQLVLKCQQ